jgi:hypothetical protein
MFGQLICCQTGRVHAVLSALSVVGQSGAAVWDTYWAGLVLLGATGSIDEYPWSYEQRDLLVSAPYRDVSGLTIGQWPPIGSAEERALLIALLSALAGGGSGTKGSGAGTASQAANAGSTELLALQAAASARAKELQSLLPAGSGGRVTIAVGYARDQQGRIRTLVASSERDRLLRPAVRDALKTDETLVPPGGHAERNIVNYAREQGWHIITVAASRPPCPSCRDLLGGR